MINGIRVLLINSAIAAIAVGDMVPFGGASKAKRPVILCSRHQPFPRVGIARHVFDFGDSKALVECGPRGSTVARSVNAAVVTSIDDLGIAGHEGQTVLVRMDTIGTLRGDISPVPGRA